MITIAAMVSLGEGTLLVGVVIALVRLQIRVRGLSDQARGTVAQMHEWVREAEALTSALAMQLTEQGHAAPVEEGISHPAPRAVAAQYKSTQNAARRIVPAGTQPLSTNSGAIGVPEEVLADRQTAREKGMDPVGVALQRTLVARGSRPA